MVIKFLFTQNVPNTSLAEVYSYVRSPYKDLFVYDTVVQVRNL